MKALVKTRETLVRLDVRMRFRQMRFRILVQSARLPFKSRPKLWIFFGPNRIGLQFIVAFCQRSESNIQCTLYTLEKEQNSGIILIKPVSLYETMKPLSTIRNCKVLSDSR